MDRIDSKTEDAPRQARRQRESGVSSVVLGAIALLIVVLGHFWESQSTGGIQWGRQIWVVLIYVVFAVPASVVVVRSVILSRRKGGVVVGLALLCASAIAMYLLFFLS